MSIKTKTASIKTSSQKVSQKKTPGQHDLLVAGIGASAGGLETLETFFSNMPPDSGIALWLSST